jgi:predicted HNH restriction endonuclease
MAAWIFQANPDVFDIDGYLDSCSGDFYWLVTRYKDQLALGDKVYIWRSQGKSKDKSKSGVIAEARIAERVEYIPPEDSSRRFWHVEADATTPADRIRLRLVRIANKKEILRREWLENDAKLKSLLILRQASGTNFPVSQVEEARLSELWAKTGSDWSEPEVVAALKIYSELWDKPISKTTDSPVGQVAQRIGRATTGVYNKVMNLRALDPRVEAAGLTGGSKADARVWDRYFDARTRTFRKQALDQEFERLWGSNSEKPQIPVEETIEPEVRRLSTRTLAELVESYQRAPKQQTRKQPTQSETFVRNPKVVAITLLRAHWLCEVDGCTSPMIEGADGKPIMEVHHLVRLADGGIDDPSNTVCVCPNHHRELHHGKKSVKLTIRLQELRKTEGAL